MRAMILAAGFGTRLGHLTERRPKAMLEIGGRPLLEHIIGNLAKHGYSDIAINLHFMAESIQSHFGDGSAFNVSLVYSNESELLGTAGGVLEMAEFLTGDEAFLIHYGDIVSDQDLGALGHAHRKREALATTLVHQREGSNSVVSMDDEQRIIGFLERPSRSERRGVVSPWVNSGVCLCDPEVFDFFPRQQPSDLPKQVFPRLLGTGRFFGFGLTGYRCAVDSEERLRQVRNALLGGRYRPAWL